MSWRDAGREMRFTQSLSFCSLFPSPPPTNKGFFRAESSEESGQTEAVAVVGLAPRGAGGLTGHSNGGAAQVDFWKGSVIVCGLS